MEEKKRKINKKKVIIAIVCVFLIVLFILVLIMNIVKERKELNNNMDVIKKNYSELSTNVATYNEIRTDLLEKLNNFTYEAYPKEKEAYTEILTKYNENIQKIDNNVSKIDQLCTVIYKDISINKICDNYKLTYEKLINLYVDDLTNYNKKVTSYNEYKETDSPLFELIHKEYIDYNEDKVYEGMDVNNEENQEEK